MARIPDIKVRLAEAAFNLFSERGIINVSVDDISSSVGVTKGSFYTHYKSRDEIIMSACRCYYQLYHQRVLRLMSEIMDPGIRLREVLLDAVHACIIDHKNRRFTMDIFSLSLSNEEVRVSWSMFLDSIRQMYIGLVQSVCASGELHVPNIPAVVDVMLAAMEGIKLRSVYEPEIAKPENQQRIFNELYQILFP